MEHDVDYIEIWMDDYEWIIDCMVRNMQSDLACGYNPHGKSILEQISMISETKKRRDDGIEKIAQFESDRRAQRWCYMDLKRRGAIS